jgi:hypothetical protein
MSERALFFRSTEDAEVYGTVGAHLYEERMVGEVVGLAMLHDEDASGTEQFALKHEPWDIRQFAEVIRRVSKDEIETFATGIEIAEDIAAHQLMLGA